MNHFSFLSACCRLFLLLLLTSWQGAYATGEEQQEPQPGWDLSLGIGLGVRSNPVMDNRDIPLLLIPKVSYQSEHFFLQNLDLGLKLVDSEVQQLNLLLTPSYDQLFFNSHGFDNFIVQAQDVGFTNASLAKTPDNNQPHDINKAYLHPRRMAYLGGLEYNLAAAPLDIQLQLMHELTGYYAGNEVRIALGKTIEVGPHSVRLTLAANWQSAATLDYFYGLDMAETRSTYQYHPGSGITGLLRLDWNYQINEQWSLDFFTSYRRLPDAITQSPLVTHNNVITSFIGGVYHF